MKNRKFALGLFIFIYSMNIEPDHYEGIRWWLYSLSKLAMLYIGASLIIQTTAKK